MLFGLKVKSDGYSVLKVSHNSQNFSIDQDLKIIPMKYLRQTNQVTISDSDRDFGELDIGYVERSRKNCE